MSLWPIILFAHNNIRKYLVLIEVPAYHKTSCFQEAHHIPTNEQRPNGIAFVLTVKLTV